VTLLRRLADFRARLGRGECRSGERVDEERLERRDCVSLAQASLEQQGDGAIRQLHRARALEGTVEALASKARMRDASLEEGAGEERTLLAEVVDVVARAGATITEGWPEGIEPGAEAESFGYHVGLFFAFQQPDEEFKGASALIDQENRRMSARAAWNRCFEDVDVFLCPANFTPAFPHDSRPFDERTIATPEGARPYDNQPFWISHASLPGLPAAVAPIGKTPGGLPVGVQIIGPIYEDDTPLTFAELLSPEVGGYERPPI
jgi:Asp-tRNA(Asn)/Glu-tRNA(Gln) amidotransferase A subunit family amidase